MNTDLPDSTRPQPSAASPRLAALALIPSAVAFNVVVGLLVHTFKVPLYLDCIGVIAATLIAGWRVGIIVGILSFGLAAVLGNPQVIFFTGTPIAVALYTHFLGKRGAFKSMFRTVLTGIGMGVLAGTISAPVVALVFGGVTSAGSAAVTTFFLKTGQSLLQSVILSGATCEPVDKVAQCLIAIWLVRAVPRDLLARFGGGTLDKNLNGFRYHAHAAA